MERWAGSKLGQDHCHFVMVSVDGAAARVAELFVRTYGLRHARIGYAAGRASAPPFPAQLGCMGLVIFDAEGSIVTSRSPALNEVGVKAFATVDATVAALCFEDDDDDDVADAASRVYQSMRELQEDVFDPPGCRPAAPVGQVQPGWAPVAPPPPPPPTRLGAVPSVGHAGMDTEHEECAVAFAKLKSERTAAALAALVSELASHFDHEEALLKASGFGAGVPDGLSPLVSHAADHKRILGVARAEQRTAGAGPVREGCAEDLAALFEAHATQFDARYEEYVRAA